MYTPRLSRALVASASLVLIWGCTSYSHFESQSRLESLHAAKVAAEAQAFDQVEEKGPEEKFNPSRSVAAGEPITSLSAARERLAEDALADAEDATSGGVRLSDADKISMLYRAAVKGWHAGNAWNKLNAQTAAAGGTPGEPSGSFQSRIGDGGELCRQLAEKGRQPRRDCAVIAAFPALTILETGASDIVDAHLAMRAEEIVRETDPDGPGGGWSPEAAVAEFATGVGSIRTGLEKLGKTQAAAEGIPELAGFMDAQRFAYFCQSARAMNDLSEVTLRGPGQPQLAVAREVQKLMQSKPDEAAEPSAELVAALQGRVSNVKGLAGAYREVVETINERLALDQEPGDYRTADRALCKAAFEG